MASNARFWVWHNGGWVKLTLKPSQSLRHRRFATTDEGWRRCVDVWTYVADEGPENLCVLWGWREESMDCDGRLDRYGDFECPVHALKDRDMFGDADFAENKGIFAPAWEKQKSGQRDYEAEKAGY